MNILITLNNPSGEDRGAVLRVRALIEELKIDRVLVIGWKEKPKYFYKEKIDVVTLAFRPIDIVLTVYCLLKCFPLQTAFSQRSIIKEHITKDAVIYFHLLRTLQISLMSGETLKHHGGIDICESLSLNYKNRAKLIGKGSVKFFVFLLESFLMGRLENRVRSMPLFFISKTDPLFGVVENARIITNNILFQAKRHSIYEMNSPLICFIGHVDYEPNLIGLETICDWIMSSGLKIQVHAYGSFSNKSAVRLERFRCLSLFGYIENLDDISHFYSWGLCYTPGATGFQNKFYDYRSLGLPVIVSKNLSDFASAEDIRVVGRESEFRELFSG